MTHKILYSIILLIWILVSILIYKISKPEKNDLIEQLSIIFWPIILLYFCVRNFFDNAK